MSKRNRYKDKNNNDDNIDIKEIQREQLIRRALVKGDRTERVNFRCSDEIKQWLDKQSNMSRYIVGLIADDMIKRGEV